VVSAAIETARPSIDAKSHELVVHFAKKALHVEGDPVRLSQIISNLLINAAKFTPAKGRIELTLRDSPGENGPGQLEIIVRDNGMGIEADELPRVFKMFEQLGQAQISAGGLGLGLALARSLAELHGGRVEVRSEGRGQGSEFIVRLPLAEQSPESAPQRLAPVLSGKSRRVLVVDDNQDAAITLSAMLAAHGHEVRHCFSAQEALSSNEGVLPEVAFLDLNMPGMDGYELARRIRMRPGGSSVRIIALTGMGRESDISRTRETGFDAHLTKPADPDGILRLIETSPEDDTVVPFARVRMRQE
jgi:CheY-like chemotaxis protein/anti-sigma regulatory factor (Ser/Thr protein kinase)